MTPDAAFKELTKRCGLILRQHGFKGSGQNFRREVEEVWQIVNFQKSQWRVDRDCPISFTLNLGMHFPKLKAARRSRAPRSLAKLTQSNADLSLRVGHVMSKGDDQWWEIDGKTLPTFAPKFDRILTKNVIPALDLISTTKGLASACRSKPAIRGWLSGTAEAWLKSRKSSRP